MNYILKAIFIALGICMILGLIIFAAANYGENCEREKVCEKAVGSSFGPQYLEVDCNSNNVDRTRMRCVR